MRSQIVLACTSKKMFYILKTFTSLLFICREKFLSLSQDVLKRCDVSRFFLSDASVLPCSHCEEPSDWPIRKCYQLMTNVKMSKCEHLSWSLFVILAHLLLSAGTSAPVTRIHQPERGFSEDCSETSSLEEGERSRPVRSALETHANTITSAHAALTAAVSSLSFLFTDVEAYSVRAAGLR